MHYKLENHQQNLSGNPQQNLHLENFKAFSPSKRIAGNTVWYLKENFSSEKKTLNPLQNPFVPKFAGRERESKKASSLPQRDVISISFFRAFNLIFMKFMCNIVLPVPSFTTPLFFLSFTLLCCLYASNA